MLRLSCFSLFCLMLVAPACHRPTATPRPQPRFRVENRKFERQIPGCGDTSKRAEPCMTFHVEWPEVVETVEPGAAPKLNAAIQARLQPAEATHGLEQEANEFAADYQRAHTQFPQAALNYFVRRDADVVYSGPTLLSIEFDQSEYRGGAHATAERFYLNLRPRSAASVELSELLVGGTMPRLLTAAERAFRRRRGIDEGVAFSVARFSFPTNRFALPENWGVTGTGLVFHYNPSEVAPFELGPTTITVPWNELNGILRPDAGLAPAR
jgi:hypothetical protein